MFDGLRDKVKGVFRRVVSESKLSKEFKDIFEVGGVPAFNQFYYFGIFIWKYLYKGFYSPWHLIKAPTIENYRNKRELYRMDIPKAISAELAGLIWNEQCEVNVSRIHDEGEDADTGLDEFVHDVLTKNNFWGKMQEHIEQAMALGGGALKAWYEEKHDADGAPIPGTGEIKIGYCMADQFVPTAWTNAEVTEGVFISREAKDGYYYTRLEWHKWDGETYYITNELYRSEIKPQNREQEPQDILGFRYPLNAIYPFLQEKTPVEGITHSLLAYYRTAIANNLDDNSPLGVSIYANALSTLRALDIAYDSLVSEFRLGKKRIIVPAQCISTVTDPKTGEPHRFFDTSSEAYEALSTDDPSSLKIQDNSVELRVEEHVSAINALLSILCLQVGFSSGTFTFDRAQGLRTATEVISENSKTYKTIKGHQSQVKYAIARIVDSIIEIAIGYDVQYKGRSVAEMAAGGWETKVVFDDSILQDRQTNINQGVLLVGNGLMSKKTFIEDILGYTEEQAAEELRRIADEKRVTGTAYDVLEMGGAE